MKFVKRKKIDMTIRKKKRRYPREEEWRCKWESGAREKIQKVIVN